MIKKKKTVVKYGSVAFYNRYRRGAITSFKHRFIISFLWSAHSHRLLGILTSSLARSYRTLSLLLSFLAHFIFFFFTFWAAFSKNDLIQAVTNDTWFVQIWRYQNIFYTFTRKNDDTILCFLPFFRFFLGVSHHNPSACPFPFPRHPFTFSSFIFPSPSYNRKYLRPCLYLSRNIGNDVCVYLCTVYVCVCIWSCVQSISDYFCPAAIFRGGCVKFIRGAILT